MGLAASRQGKRTQVVWPKGPLRAWLTAPCVPDRVPPTAVHDPEPTSTAQGSINMNPSFADPHPHRPTAGGTDRASDINLSPSSKIDAAEFGGREAEHSVRELGQGGPKRGSEVELKQCTSDSEVLRPLIHDEAEGEPGTSGRGYSETAGKASERDAASSSSPSQSIPGVPALQREPRHEKNSDREQRARTKPSNSNSNHSPKRSFNSSSAHGSGLTMSASFGPQMPRAGLWKKGESLGCGAFGAVFLGLNSETGELLAVKEVAIHEDPSKTQESVDQLEQEVGLLSTLQHPNIVRYVGTLREKRSLYIFLEYVAGGSIASMLARFGRFEETVIRLYTKQILEGLAYLHSNRTVHRDIKGGNILVEKSGRIKLADFGMAKQMVENMSVTKSFKGSAFWMAPEVIRQRGHGFAADVWSFGCTVLEMATGKPPWSQCSTQVQAIFKIASSSELPHIPESLSPEGTEFILLCLQRDSAARPSALDLLQHPFVADVELNGNDKLMEYLNFTSRESMQENGGSFDMHSQQHSNLLHRRTQSSNHAEAVALITENGLSTHGMHTHATSMSRTSSNTSVSASGNTVTIHSDGTTSYMFGGGLGSNLMKNKSSANTASSSIKLVDSGTGRNGREKASSQHSGTILGSSKGLMVGEDGNANNVGDSLLPHMFKVQGLLRLPPLKLPTSNGGGPVVQRHSSPIPKPRQA